MVFLYIILALLVVLFVWDMMKGIRIVFTAHASPTEMIARVGIQRPVLSFELQRNAPSSPMLNIHLFGIRLIRKAMVAKRKPGGFQKGLRLARAATISRLVVSADYSLGDPFNTAMALPAAGALARFLPFEQLEVEPDYLSVEPFLFIRGNATIKFGETILKYIRKR